MKEHILSHDFYDLETMRALLDAQPTLRLSKDVAASITAGANFVTSIAMQDRHLYGINTGFGALCTTRIPADEFSALQHNHLMSHACGVGDPAPEAVTRLAMLLKLLTFRSGHSGISLDTVNRFLMLWNASCIPIVPQKGTVGASGDLAPLAHLSLPLIGLGQVRFGAKVVSAADALAQLDLSPLRLGPKEALALTNGTQYVNGYALYCLMQLTDLANAADVIAAITIQAFSAADTFFDPLLDATWRQPERRTVAHNLRVLLAGSNHFDLPQASVAKEDPYSLRCIPQVHGAIRRVLVFAREVVEEEINSVSDNPLFFPSEGKVLYCGNMHGESTAMAMDMLAIAAAELANISERRTYQLLSGQHGLPDFLTPRPGINSGLMIAQYTSAALVNENKVLATPACVDTIPTCHLQEDHVSMAGTSAYKLEQIVKNCETVLAIELLTAVQAAELNQGLRLSSAGQELVDEYRKTIPTLLEDRLLSDDIEKSCAFLRAHLRAWTAQLGKTDPEPSICR